MSKLKKRQFKIEGTHCKSCKTLIETEVDVMAGVKSITVDYYSGESSVEFDNSKISFEKIKNKIEKYDYKVSVAGQENKQEKESTNPYKNIFIAIFIFVLVIGYLILKRYSGFEILAQLNTTSISYWLILIIGLLVSFHCVGMCGGLVVTFSAGHAAKQDKEPSANSGREKVGFSKLHFQYNFGRLISYTIIGGILGGIGSFFAINPNFSGAVMLMAGIFMILMAVSLYTHFKWLEKLQPKMPQFIARFLYSQKHTKKPKGPFIIGLLNGFMPCGPLQAMQLYALGTGSLTRGALSMAVYGLGTIPLMFGFGAFISTLSSQYIKKVMKFSAVVVAILGLVMINRGLINFGWGLRSLIPSTATSQTEFVVNGNVSEYQIVNMDLSYRGYEPNVLYVKQGIPVRWIINVKQMSGCTDEIHLDAFNIKKPLEYGENIIEFLPTQVGEIKFSCWMKMVWGKFIVTEDSVNPSAQQLKSDAADLAGTSCGGAGGCGCSGAAGSRR
ncbi:sulfite exporter TauE/SafE family protein [Patescibacteria group bacterium]|nr:sulfite exporter TauE/SafE family protein [Patescibacteria group bacterium]